ncbi:MAG: hypothetical protein JST21_16370 [Bacteroidetes bacterium]|nr:hypothetical protein [Bacteroidota bacterium]
MRRLLFAFYLSILVFFSCSKTKDNHVSIRVHNNSPAYFTTIVLKEKSFTEIKPFTTSSYQIFNQVSDLPYVQLINVSNDTIYAGNLYYDAPVSFLSQGKYTLEIFEDTTAFSGYNCQYIKDE